MKLLVCAATAALLCVLSVPVSSRSPPYRPPPDYGSTPCGRQTCGWNQECRKVEECFRTNTGKSCHVADACVAENDSQRYSYGCRSGNPLLIENSGRYQLRTCSTYANIACPEGYFCSSELQDTASRCCPGSGSNNNNNGGGNNNNNNGGNDNIGFSNKDGHCPVPVMSSQFSCITTCSSDAECPGTDKCCQYSAHSQQKSCLPVHPCSFKNCPTGLTCLAGVNNIAVCASIDPIGVRPVPTRPIRPVGPTMRPTRPSRPWYG